jgi:hypothetical protein
MRNAVLGLTLGLVTALAMPAIAAPKAARPSKAAKAAGDAETSLGKEERQKLREHMLLREHIVKHVKYPATKQELVSACKGMHEMKTDDKNWFEETLPDKTYNSPDEVMKALGWEVAPQEKTEK